jgi:hypothetical protein
VPNNINIVPIRYAVGTPLSDLAKLRFAVGIFDDWEQLREALRDVRIRGLVLDSFNCLALQRAFEGKVIMAPNQNPVPVRVLPFADSSEPVACTAGPLADCLMERVDSGAGSLGGAFGHWFIPRHAKHFEDAVRAGRILFWIQIHDADDERNAYQNLLAYSSNSVGVHDLPSPVSRRS